MTAACERDDAAMPAGISAAILAGGGSRRMGADKALLPFRGKPLIAHVYDLLSGLFAEVFVVTGRPGRFPFLPCGDIADRVPGRGPIAGVDAALRHARGDHVFITACDMPFLSPAVVRMVLAETEGADLVIPCSPRGPEPLCAAYGKGCLIHIEEAMAAGEAHLLGLVDRVGARRIPSERVALADPEFRSFRNVNTPEEFRSLAP